MPAEIITVEFCADYVGTFQVEGSKGDTYTVTWDGLGAHCTCPAFKFSRDRQCKHADFVYANGCFWNPQWKDEVGTRKVKPIAHHGWGVLDDGNCPGCGGPTVPTRIAV